jgi:glycosyltransferase involved in cell wall biosynthesis
MRLSLVTDTYPPDVNGVALTLRRLRGHLVGRGHVVEVIVPGDLRERACETGEIDPAEPAAALRLAALPVPGYKGLRFGLPARGPLRRHWQEHRPDIVYVATESLLGFSAVDAAKDLGIPAVSGFHTNFDSYMADYKLPMLKDLTGGYLRTLHNRTAATFAPSPDLIARLTQEGFRNIRLLGRGVDTVMFDPARRDPALRAAWGAGPTDTVALYVGRIAPEKNLPLAERAYARLAAAEAAAGRRLVVVVVGDGPKRADWEKAHPDFVFAGMRGGNDLAAHYASADLFVFPSTSETFGNVVLEAFASGLVVVAYAYAAAQLHLHDGTNCLAAPFGDEDAFLAACDRARDRQHWPAWRAAARATALALGWDAVVDRFELDLLEIIAAAAPASTPGGCNPSD